jgi:hypothetical protein
MECPRIEERADDGQGPPDGRISPPLDERSAGICGREAKQQVHGRRLPRAVRPHEPGDEPGLHGDRQLVDGDGTRVTL